MILLDTCATIEKEKIDQFVQEGKLPLGVLFVVEAKVTRMYVEVDDED